MADKYDELLLERLKNDDYALEYFKSALEDCSPAVDNLDHEMDFIQSVIGNLKRRKKGEACITLILKHQPDGVFTVNCKELPELLTQGDSVEEALENAKDAFITTLELYEDYNRELPIDKAIFA